MREKAFKIVLFAALGLTASTAFALRGKPAPQAAAHRAHKTAAFYVHGSGERAKTRVMERKVAEARVLRSRRGASKGKAAPGTVERKEVARAAAVAGQARVEAAPVDGDDTLGVRHNRKIHLTEQSAAADETSLAVPEALNGPRRPATIEDFVRGTTGAAARPDAASGAEAELENQPPAVKPVAAAKIERRLAAKAVPDVAVAAAPPVAMPALYTRSGRLIVPPALKGSHEILVRQNEMADAEGLDRVQDDADLERLRAAKLLVAIPASAALAVDERLPANRRYCRPWTAQFLAALARAHYARFHSALQVNSAVRTVEFQERLRYTNGNAAPAEGETASPHLTGQAVDLAKHGLSMTEIAWLRGYLLPLVQQGKVDVEEEFQQACFHVSVYRKYLPQAAPRRVVPTRHGAGMALAAAMR